LPREGREEKFAAYLGIEPCKLLKRLGVLLRCGTPFVLLDKEPPSSLSKSIQKSKKRGTASLERTATASQYDSHQSLQMLGDRRKDEMPPQKRAKKMRKLKIVELCLFAYLYFYLASLKSPKVVHTLQ
jgi:hypothetical protein